MYRSSSNRSAIILDWKLSDCITNLFSNYHLISIKMSICQLCKISEVVIYILTFIEAVVARAREYLFSRASFLIKLCRKWGVISLIDSVNKSKHHWSFGSSVRDQKPRDHKLLSLENFLACEHKLGKLYQAILYSVDTPRTVCWITSVIIRMLLSDSANFDVIQTAGEALQVSLKRHDMHGGILTTKQRLKTNTVSFKWMLS